MNTSTARLTLKRLSIVVAALGFLGACSPRQPVESFLASAPTAEIAAVSSARTELAMIEAKQKQRQGQRVWCVPFARTASGVEIRGNAKTWWRNAAGVYQRGAKPKVGAVMAFAGSRKMPMGHVAVVSDIVSSREVKVNHANWERNKVSMGMSVIDVSKRNDWSAVRVQRSNGQMGTGNYPLNGFIYPG